MEQYIPFVLLGIAAFFAGLVDAVVGGGGLIQVPALLSAFPKVEIPVLFGTNKIASIVGTTSAACSYLKRVRIPYRIVLPGMVAAFLGAMGGASVVSFLPKDYMRPLVVVLMILVGVYTFRKKDFGQTADLQGITSAAQWLCIGIGLSVGFYDGFFGPGAGSFFIFLLIRFVKMNFLQASASAKLMNISTNFGAILYFSHAVSIMWILGIFMAVCNLCGAVMGSHLAMKKGSAFVRIVFLWVVSLLVVKLGWDSIKGFT